MLFGHILVPMELVVARLFFSCDIEKIDGLCGCYGLVCMISGGKGQA